MLILACKSTKSAIHSGKESDCSKQRLFVSIINEGIPLLSSSAFLICKMLKQNWEQHISISSIELLWILFSLFLNKWNRRRRENQPVRFAKISGQDSMKECWERISQNKLKMITTKCQSRREVLDFSLISRLCLWFWDLKFEIQCQHTSNDH